jgi:hypothetical protein
LTENEKKSENVTLKKSLSEGCVSAQSVDAIRKGLVSGSNVQQVRDEIKQPKKPKEK